MVGGISPKSNAERSSGISSERRRCPPTPANWGARHRAVARDLGDLSDAERSGRSSLEEEMRGAADLRFEKVARFRDEVKDLR